MRALFEAEKSTLITSHNSTRTDLAAANAAIIAEKSRSAAAIQEERDNSEGNMTTALAEGLRRQAVLKEDLAELMQVGIGAAWSASWC